MKSGLQHCVVCHHIYDLDSLEELTSPWRKTLDCEDFCSDECRTKYLID